MSDHEQLSEEREQEADALEQESERVGQVIEEAKEARDEAAGDSFVATPVPGRRGDGTRVGGDLSEAGEHVEEGDTPGGPETDYPTKR